jgi:chaperone modulatory protein CbpM
MEKFMWMTDFDLDEPLSCEVVAETVGARRSLIVRLARQGLIETLESGADEPLLPRRAVVQLRRMQRLRRDLRVNFTGAAIILDLVGRIEELNRELSEYRPDRSDRSYKGLGKG